MPTLHHKREPRTRPWPLIIALAAKKQHGKDTAADWLVANHDFTKLSFAAPMKASGAAALGVDVETLEALKEHPRAVVQVRVKNPFLGQEDDVIHEITIREYWQKVGTEAHRMIPEFGMDVWVDMMNPKVALPGRYVIVDARFENEQRRVKELEGHVVQINRPGMPTGDGHASEQIDHGLADFVVENDADLATYVARIEWVLAAIRAQRDVLAGL